MLHARKTRFYARVSPELKAKIRYAASLKGVSMSAFVAASVEGAARRALAEAGELDAFLRRHGEDSKTKQK